MKEPYGGTVTKVSSTEIIAGDKMATAPSAKVKEPSALETEDQIFISNKKHRIIVKSESMFHCKETGIKFEVEIETSIEYSVKYGDECMTLIQDNGYELLGPIFNVQVLSGRVSAVYLPHYVCLEGFKGDESLIKFGHFKDGKLTLKTPDDIDGSYLKLKDPDFSWVAAVGEPFLSFWKRKKHYPYNGQVLLYARVAGKETSAEFRIHLYLIPDGIPYVENLTELKEREGFQKISKRQVTKKVYAGRNYIITGEPDADIDNETLTFTKQKKNESLDFVEVNFSKDALLKNGEPILLRVKAEKSSESEPVWKGKLTRDIEEVAEQSAQRERFGKDFIDKHSPELIQNVTNIMPVLDDLKKNDLLTGESYNTVKSQKTSQDKMRSLLDFGKQWGSRDQNTLYQALKRHNKSCIKKIEKGN
ncbi:NACHT, LRR and PYD domains-containing protein 1b allele 2-like isoform X2 [Dendropsophus ebraccatus]|uniref:NACHT, LRR and PYD domains-containing protein 1b allele 2-like isoform X2 n=1 Tax=Dendropsophus ebraccatus TaxID=150705 RepID=UPI003831F7D2